jgi:hypothetical protein
METIAHQCKDPINHFKHFNSDGKTKQKCWKLHLELNLKNRKKDAKKNNILSTDLRNQVESSSNLYENIIYTSVQKGVNLSILHHQ